MTKAKLVDYILSLRFPPEAAEILADQPESRAQEEIHAALSQDMENNRRSLERMSVQDLEELAEAESQRLDTERKEEENRRPFYERRSARADFKAWSEIHAWNLDQATALLLSKEPTVVRWDRLEPLIDDSPFARSYGQLRALLNAGLSFPIRPAELVAWAASRIAIPKELSSLIPLEKRPQGEPVRLDREPLLKPPKFSGGSTRAAIKEVLVEKYGSTRPTGLKKKQVEHEVRSRLKELGKDHNFSESTFNRAYKELYGSSRHDRT